VFWLGGCSLTPNEDIVRYRCGKGEATLPAFGKEKFIFSGFGKLCATLIGFDPSNLSYYLGHK